MLMLGTLHSTGRGVERDYTKAAEWYWKAADAGNSLGLRYLVNYYIYGWGVDKDLGKALELLDRYSESGNDDVSGLYGNYYYTLKDYDKAAEYYTAAADSGDAAAMRQLGQIYKKMIIKLLWSGI